MSTSSSKSTPLLNQIIAAFEQSKTKFLLIEDCVSNDAKPLLTNWIREQKSLGKPIVYWSYELNDLIGKELKLASAGERPVTERDLATLRNRCPNITIINSLNSMATQLNLTYVELAGYLRQLTSCDKSAILALLHLDGLVDCGRVTLDVPAARLFRMLASSRIRFCPRANDNESLVKCMTRKSDGRVQKRLECFEICDGVRQSKVVREPDTDRKRDVAVPQTTFSLELNDAERDARARLELPFWRKQERDEADDRCGSNRISYEPDENDDWDYEDPDDDLDI